MKCKKMPNTFLTALLVALLLLVGCTSTREAACADETLKSVGRMCAEAGSYGACLNATNESRLIEASQYILKYCGLNVTGCLEVD
jgi:uncharacterized protein YcfL